MNRAGIILGVLLVFLVAVIYRCKGDLLEVCGEVDEDGEQMWDNDKWYKWAQLYSFCKDSYNNGNSTRNSSSTFNDRCSDNANCTKCLSVCRAKDDDKKTTCSQCNNAPCKVGCQFYDYLFEKQGNFTVDKLNLPRPNSSVVKDTSTTNNVFFSWERVESSGSRKVPTIYLLAIRQNKHSKQIIVGLMETTNYTLHSTTMCENMYEDPYTVHDLKFALYIYPVNVNGPTKWDDAKKINLSLTSEYASPTLVVATLKNVTVQSGFPIFGDDEKHKPDLDDIIWHLEWRSINDSRAVGVAFNYSIVQGKYKEPCSGTDYSQLWQINKELTRQNYHFANATGPAIVRLHDPVADDKLALCKCDVELSIKYGECFISQPFKKRIRYSGCKSIDNYTNPCVKPTTTPPPINTYLSPNHTNLTATYCKDCGNNSTPMFAVNIAWDSYPQFSVNSYTVAYRMENEVKTYREFIKVPRENKTRTVQVPHDYAHTNLQMKVIIHAETNHSDKTIWKFFILPKFETSIWLNVTSDTENPGKSPGNQTALTVGISVVVVLGIAMFCIKMYRDRQQRRKKELYMQNNGIYNKKDDIVIIPDEWEIYPANIDVKKKLGEGAFGTVHSARIDVNVIAKSKFAAQCGGVSLMSEKSKLVAVKFLKEGAGVEENNDFKDEMTFMKGLGYHRNIVNMIGCSTIKQPLCLIVEYMHNADLLHYLRKQRAQQLNNDYSETNTENENENISLNDMMSFAWQIACGMEYLASKKIVHRDLAARNVLVSSDKRAKISDFGLSRQATDELIYISKNKHRKIPVKWMSIEAIYQQLFTMQSDVWSYGVVLFEIVTLGGAPYPLIKGEQLCKMLKSGYRMERPDNCSVEMHDIMGHCWNEIPARRPTFTELREHLEKMMEKGASYFSFEIDYSKPYYNVASFKSVASDDEEETTLFTKEYDDKPIQVKVIEAVSVPVDDSVQEKHDTSEVNDGSELTARYISPDSLKSFTDTEKTISLDNGGFHFTE